MILLPNTTTYNENREWNVDVLDRCLFEIARGNGDALEELYHSAAPAIHALALSMLKNSHDAEDVLHDCFLHIYSGAGSYHSIGKPMAWILTITKNLCYQKLRERQRQADLPQEDWEPWLEENGALSHEDRLAIRQCMELLSDEEREIVILHAVAGFRHREIGALMDLPLSTVLSKYHRAIKKLRNHF